MAQQQQQVVEQMVILPPSIDRDKRRFNTWQEAEEACKMTLPHAVRELFKQPRCEQKTDEWLLAREGAITGSDFAAAIDLNPYSSRNQFIKKKVTGERTFFGNAATRHGELYEDCALHMYEAQTGAYVLDFGLLSHHKVFENFPAKNVGNEAAAKAWFREMHADTDMKAEWTWLKASPDGVALLKQDDGSTKAVLLEIKCPMKNFFEGRVAMYYYAQVQLLMEVMNLDECHFVQYIPPQLPFFEMQYDMKVVPRDREWMHAAKQEARCTWHTILRLRNEYGANDDSVRTSSGMDNYTRVRQYPDYVVNPKNVKRTHVTHPHIKPESLSFLPDSSSSSSSNNSSDQQQKLSLVQSSDTFNFTF